MKNSNILTKTNLTILLILSILSNTTYAQVISVIADYPLIENLADSTERNSDVILTGNPTPPTLPSKAVALCSNGIYVIDQDGQDIITPIIPILDIDNFQIEVEFMATQLPLPTDIRPRMPIIMGSKFARWLGIYVDSSGLMGFKFNNSVSNYRWSNTSIAGAGIWYSSKIRYLNGHVDLYLDDQLILSDDIGALNTWQNTFNFTVTDFSEGNPLNGCIRNLIISSNDVIFKDGFE